MSLYSTIKLILEDISNIAIVRKREGFKRFFAMLYVFLFYANFKPVRNFRIYSYLVRKGGILKIIGFIIYERNKKKYTVDINPYASIGKGFCIGHLGSIIIGSKAKIGNYVVVNNDVNIGEKWGEGMPKIKDGVYIWAGAKGLGNIEIGNNCIIGAHSVVIESFPDNVIIAGITAKIIKKLK